MQVLCYLYIIFITHNGDLMYMVIKMICNVGLGIWLWRIDWKFVYAFLYLLQVE